MYDDIVIDRMGAAVLPRAPRSATEHTALVARAPLAARFALRATVLPSLANAVAVGDCVRMALIRCSDGHAVFTGRNAAGQVRRGPQHDHAWFLPADDDSDGALDHVIVYARRGFDFDALRALTRLQRVWGHGGADLDVRLVALGAPRELGSLRRHAGRACTAQLGTARIWESLTPFVPPRHVKHRADGPRDTASEQVARLLTLHGRPLPRIQPLAAEDATPPRPSPIAWHHFRRHRVAGGGSRGADVAFGFRLCFDQQVTGPIALGYGAHQGLGQFVAVA